METTLTWNTVRGMYYRLQRTTDLLNWTDVTPAMHAVNGTMSVVDTSAVSPVKLFRVIRITAP